MIEKLFMTRTEIIQLLIDKFNYKKYCEIGCDRNENFININIPIKVGVDPRRGGTLRMTSDEFFKDNNEFYDIFFIDGLHHADQVYRDITNSLLFLKPNGIIVIHDCNPISYIAQVSPKPRRWKLRPLGLWNGDVWKGWLRLRSEREDLEILVVDTDYGCGIVRKGHQELIKEWD